MAYEAHIRKDVDGTQYHQSLEAHNRNTASYAENCLEGVDLGQAAYLAGLMHDAGKYKKEFQDYLADENGIRGSVNHSFAGCRMLLEHFHGKSSNQYEDVTAELLAYAVGAHHGQFDCVDEWGKNGFLHRMQKKEISYSESQDNFIRYCADWMELEARFKRAHQQLQRVYDQLVEAAVQSGDNGQLMFQIGQLARLLLSAVIEGDRRDTAEFMSGSPHLQLLHPEGCFWAPYLHHMEVKLEEFPQDTEIQKARRKISELCRIRAESPCSVCRLNVPTGGGKTLSALRYALAHAEKWNKERIIFVTPLLTILEQNAAVIHQFIGDDSIILEHHSNVVRTEEPAETLDLHELAAESWDSPVIITTLVQLLNTMFSGKTTSIRRYHALCNAVVVIDEVQTVPDKMLSLFNTTVSFLSRICGTTFLLCSATQPCFDQAEHPLCFEDGCDIVPYEKKLWQPFRRTRIQNPGAMRLEDIPGFADGILSKCGSLLIICNKKSEAEFLYRQMASDDLNCYHLSSAMCMAHRRDMLQKIEGSLHDYCKTGRRTLCISTQVMEAGVDISFGSVIRLAAGMDSVVQSAGRCNRNGENPTGGDVYVVPCMDENLSMLREIQNAKLATLALLNKFSRNPEELENDLASDASVAEYYRKLYSSEDQGYQQFAVGRRTLFDLLSGNSAADEGDENQEFTLHQAFKTAGNLFKVLDNDTEDVIVPYGDGKSLILELNSGTDEMTPEKLRYWAFRAKPYTVSLYDYQKQKLGSAISSVNGILILQSEYYNNATGLVFEPETIYLEV